MDRPSFLWRSLQSFGVNWCESALWEDRLGTSGHLPRFSPVSRTGRDYFVRSASVLFSLTSYNSPRWEYLHLDTNFSNFLPWWSEVVIYFDRLKNSNECRYIWITSCSSYKIRLLPFFYMEFLYMGFASSKLSAIRFLIKTFAKYFVWMPIWFFVFQIFFIILYRFTSLFCPTIKFSDFINEGSINITRIIYITFVIFS